MKKLDLFKIDNFVIAEIGTNHNKKISQAISMINKIGKTSCDAIKFQIYEPHEIVNKKITSREYGLHKIYGNIPAQKMFKNFLKTPKSWFPRLKNLCHKKKKYFGITIHGENGLKFAKRIKPDFVKIASMDHNNFPFLEKIINKIKSPLIVSLGMAKIHDIKILVKLLKKHRYGFNLLHCTSLYPPQKNELRMSNILYLRNKFKIPIGFSDHSLKYEVALQAKRYGAKIFEKHVTIDNKLKGPDHSFALNIKLLDQYIHKLKKNRFILRASRKKLKFKNISFREKNIRQKYLKSIITSKNLPIGTVIKKSDLYITRPGNGIEPRFLNNVIGKKIRKNKLAETIINWKDLN